MQIDAKEQLRRFRERESVAWKRHKIGPEDSRNREKSDAYEEAVSDMIARTSTVQAPWSLCPRTTSASHGCGSWSRSARG